MSFMSLVRNYRSNAGSSLAKRVATWRRRRERSLADAVRTVACDALEPRMLMSVSMNFSDTTTAFTDTRVKNMIVCADLDDDGNNDLITVGRDAGNYYNYINIHWGKGNGTFDATSTELAVAGMISSVQAADINGDGVKDLISTCTGTDYLTVFTGALAEPRSYSPGVEYSVGSGPVAVGVGDFNGDGANDLAVVSSTTGMVNIMLGNLAANKAPTGEFTLSTTSYAVGTSPSAIIVADLNKDGVSDLVVANSGSDTISILQGNKTGKKGNGTFSVLAGNNVGDKPVALATGDFNGDGYADVAVSCSDSSEVFLLLNDKKGNLFIKSTTPETNKPTRIVAADMNGDGIDDVAVFNSQNAKFEILQVTPTGDIDLDNVWFVDTNSGGEAPVDFALADLNNDGRLDMAAIGTTSNKTMIRLNTTTEKSVLVTAKAPFTYVDATGDTVTIKLTGPGSVVVTLDSVTAASEVTLALYGTTVASTLSFAVTNVNKTAAKTTEIKSINLGTGSLGSLLAGSVDLEEFGRIFGGADSVINKIVLRDMNGGTSIDLEGAAAGGINMTVRSVKDSSHIHFANSAINTATFGNVGHGSITAKSLGTLNVTGVKGDLALVGDCFAHLTLTGNTNAKARTLGTVKVAGTVKDVSWTITGSTGAISIGADLSSFGLGVLESMESLSVAGHLHSGSLSAHSIGTLSVKGDLYSITVTLGDDAALSSTQYALKTLTVGGSLGTGAGTAATFMVPSGRVGTVTADSARGFHMALSRIDNQTVVTGSIDKVTIKKDLANSGITAIGIGSMTVGGNADGFIAMLGASGMKSTDYALKTLTVGGVSNEARVSANYGNLGSLSFGSATILTVEASNGTVDKLAITGDQLGVVVNAMAVGAWTGGGDASNINFVSTKTSSDSAIELKKLDIKGDLTSIVLQSGFVDVGAISVGGNWTGTEHVQVRSLGTCTVGGDFSGQSFVLSGDGNALGKLDVKGAAHDFGIDGVAGNAGALSFGTITNSSIKFSSGTIASLTVVGDADFGLGNSDNGTIRAKSVGTISIGTGKTGGDLKNAEMQIVSDATFTDKSVLLKSLTVNGDVNAVTAIATNLKGNIGSVTVGSLSNHSSLDFAGHAVKSVSLVKNAKYGTTGTLSGNSVIDGGVLTSVVVNGDIDSGTIAAGVNGVFAASTVTLGKLTVSGNVSLSTIKTEQGAAGTVSLKSMETGTVSIYSSLTKLDVKGDMGANSPGSISFFVGGKMGTWNVGGNLNSVLANIGGISSYLSLTQIGPRNVVLSALTVGGVMNEVDLQVWGSIGNVSAKRMTYSDIGAGYDLANAAFVGYETIGSVKITGDKNFAASSATSNRISGWKVGAVVVTYPGDNTLATAIKAMEIGSLKVTRLNGIANVTKSYTKLDHADEATFNEMGLSLSLPASITLIS